MGVYIEQAVKERSWVAYLCALPHIRRYIGYYWCLGDEACFGLITSAERLCFRYVEGDAVGIVLAGARNEENES